MADTGDRAGVFYEIVRWRLDEQSAHRAALNARLATFFATATAVLALFAALIQWGPGELELPGASAGLLIAAIAVYASMIGVSLAAYSDRSWNFGPDLRRLQQIQQQVEQEALQGWITAQMLDAVEENNERLSNKASLVWLAVVLRGLDVLLLASAALVATLV